MSRPKSSDFLSNFRFHVIITGFGAGATNQLQSSATGGTVSSGFNSCSAPEVSHDAVEYREGHYIYTRKFVGIPTVAEVTLSRGIALSDGTMWLWMKSVVEGNEEYRANMDIIHMSRDAKPATQSGGDAANTQMQVPTAGIITYHCHECFPISRKVSGDFDATSSEISIQEMTMAMEYFEEEITPPPP